MKNITCKYLEKYHVLQLFFPGYKSHKSTLNVCVPFGNYECAGAIVLLIDEDAQLCGMTIANVDAPEIEKG
ncbi:hypothetical protein C4565_03680 [Candidatus Parcubacteria bacterium]|nr:MAG: hypothetical protein C4565_03680 [Candidatus Parcubacteria bacterium]